jgi:hypothetical protein
MQVLGIDIGGSGVKGALVDLDTGEATQPGRYFRGCHLGGDRTQTSSSLASERDN